MNHQASKYSSWWWLAALVVIIGIILGKFYSGTNNSIAPSVTAVSPGVPPTEPLTVTAPAPVATPVIKPQSPPLQQPPVISQAQTAPIPEANILTPEVAREAVHAVETSVYARANRLFEQEPIDMEWAAAYENSLHAMFSQHHGLQRVSINSINCRTTMCRIEVFTPRDTDADFFTAMFYDGLENHAEGELQSEAAIARNMENGVTSVYVARKGHTLGFY